MNMKTGFLANISLAFMTAAVVISCQKEFTCEGCLEDSSRPVANAGADQVIQLPTSTLLLDGSLSTDPDGRITAWQWSKIAGPASVNITNPNEARTQVTNLTEGSFQFRLTVTDNAGQTAADTMQVIVKAAGAQSGVDLYICGQRNAKAVYWKNGQEFVLGDGNIESTATGIALDGDVVYTCGDIGDLFKYNTNQAVYWRNDKQVALTGQTGAGTSSITISGGDVYVAGWVYRGSKLAAVYWKNGELIPLTDGIADAEATGIVVIGRDVYVSGHENGVAKYWLNGKPISLTSGINQALAHSITVVGGDVYVAGAEAEGARMVAKYWKNGQAVALTDGKDFAIANAISVDGTDVYVAGYEGGYYTAVAKYWKNGQSTILSNLPGTGYARAISVFRGDVYVAGTDGGPNQFVSKYWKNQQAFPLTQSSLAQATGIVVRPR